jgi:hypothetical protein
MDSGPDLLDAPATVADARRDERDATMRLGRYARDYARARKATRPATINRARAEWGLAVYEWVQAVVALAAAEDRERASRRGAPDFDPGTAHSQPETSEADPDGEITVEQTKEARAAAHARADACWRAYDAIRRTPDQAGTALARSAWEQALTAWMRATIAHEEKQDQDAIAARQHQQEEALRLHPADAFPRNRPRARQIAHDSKERTRRENLERDRRRYGQP